MRMFLRGSTRLTNALILLLLLRVDARPQNFPADATEALRALVAAEWDYQMEQYPTWPSTLGDRRWNDRWRDDNLESIRKRHDHDRDVLAKLAKIERAALSSADRLNYDLFRKDYEERIEGFQYRRYLLPLNQLDGVQSTNQFGDALRFTTRKDYEDWLTRLKNLPARIAQTIALMRHGIEQGIVYAKIVWPRQALAYKVGQLKISELRTKAKLALADKFDVRDFHDELLKDGALPLDQLEIKINTWIDTQKLR